MPYNMKIINLAVISVIWYLKFGSVSGQDSNGVNTKKCSCGKSASLQARIIGGKIAAENEFPWQCAIFAQSQNVCGGSIINDRYVLSAAHCFIYRNPMSRQTENRDFSTITIMVGKNFLDDPEAEKIRMSELYVHAAYDPKTFYSDIAICKLENPIPEFNLFKVLPICLPPEGNSFEHYKSIVAGFGDTTARMVVRLRKVIVEVLPDETCIRKLGTKMRYTVKTMLCAALPGSDSCNGDSGGPLISELERKKFYQIGIVSYGIGCGNYDNPGVYTRVNNFIDWIFHITKDGIFCDK